MIRVLTRDNAGRNVGALYEMHRLRKSVFKDRLDWSVVVSGELEIDEYDALSPVHILSVGPTGKVRGCVRLLPSTGPYMLRDTFPELLDGNPPPVGARIWEASRFAVDAAACRNGNGLADTTCELLAAVLRFCLANGIDTIACVVDLRMERILRRAGWMVTRLGTPRRIGNTVALAGRLAVDPVVLASIEGQTGYAVAAA